VLLQRSRTSENLGNHGQVNCVSKTEQHYPSRVNQVSQNSNTNRQADRVCQSTWVSPNSSTDRQTVQVSRVNRVSRVGNTEHKTGGSNYVANMESRAMENLANTESRVTENLVNTENGVIHDSGGKKPEEGKGAAPSKRLAPQWCPRGITKTHKRRLQKMCQRELAEKKEEEEWDYWFNHLRPMTKPKQTWQEKLVSQGGRL
jgi:hypothetical protein